MRELQVVGTDDAHQPRRQQELDEVFVGQRGSRHPKADGLTIVGDQSQKEAAHTLLVLRRQRGVDLVRRGGHGSADST